MSRPLSPLLSLPDNFTATASILSAAGINGHWVLPESDQTAQGKGGAYALVIRTNCSVSLPLRTLHKNCLPAGTYIYLGSAYGPGGISARLKRHFRQNKKPHWHIDHLTRSAERIAAYAVPGGGECDLTAALLASGSYDIPLPGFGSTDCRICDSHLLRIPR